MRTPRGRRERPLPSGGLPGGGRTGPGHRSQGIGCAPPRGAGPRWGGGGSGEPMKKRDPCERVEGWPRRGPGGPRGSRPSRRPRRPPPHPGSAARPRRGRPRGGGEEGVEGECDVPDHLVVGSTKQQTQNNKPGRGYRYPHLQIGFRQQKKILVGENSQYPLTTNPQWE